MFPGLGHLYIRRKDGLWTILLGYACFLTMVIFILHSKNTAAIVFSMIPLLFSMIFHSIVEVEYQCNMIKMPYCGESWEMRIKDYFRAFIVSAAVPGSIAITILFVGCINNFDPYVIAAILLWVAYIAIIALFAKKCRNKKYSDMICPRRDV